jgi:uncharacterized membrane protein
MDGIGSLVVLSIMNWLHLVAMLVWLGGVVSTAFYVVPTAEANLGRTLGPAVMGRFMGALAKRVRIPAYVSMGIFIVTGMIMWVLNKSYLGLFIYGNAWTNVLLVKQILFVLLIVLDICMMEVLVPKIEQLAPKGPSAELSKVQRRQIAVGITTVIVLALVLAFTAWSGAISALK